MEISAPKRTASLKSSPLVNLIKGKPVLVIFEITMRCNSACGYCDLPLNKGHYELSREEINRLFADLYQNGVRHLFIQGGEPLLRQDLPDILEDLAGLGFTLSLVTNGTRLTSELIARFAKLPLTISVSLDTLERTSYCAIRGRDQLPKVLAGLALLADYPHPKYLTCIVNEQNKTSVHDVAAFAQTHGFTPVFGAYHWEVGPPQGTAKGGYGKADVSLQYDRQSAIAVFDDLLTSDILPPRYFAGYFGAYLKDTRDWLDGRKLSPCDAGKYSITIDVSGNVAACLAMPTIGNLRQHNLTDILAQIDRSAVKKCSDNSTCNLLCSRVVGAALRHPVAHARRNLF